MKLRRVAVGTLGVAVLVSLVFQAFVVPERNRASARSLRDLCGNAVREGWSLSVARVALSHVGCNLESTFDEDTAKTNVQLYTCSVEYRDLDMFTRYGVTVAVRVSPAGKVMRAEANEWLDGL